jgi:DNA mismatch repair ATPase MutS
MYQQQVNELNEQNIEIIDDLNQIDTHSNDPSKIASTIKNIDSQPYDYNQNKAMLQKVRKTAKWSQLYKSNPTFPPKHHKVMYIDQDDENK